MKLFGRGPSLKQQMKRAYGSRQASLRFPWKKSGAKKSLVTMLMGDKSKNKFWHFGNK